jgi:hypothetical protein
LLQLIERGVLTSAIGKIRTGAATGGTVLTTDG